MTATVLLQAARALFGEGIAVAAGDPTAPATGLLPEETMATGAMVDHRRREFAAGRRAARAAMQAIGQTLTAIPVGVDRAPRWPVGLVGSITHSATRCLAALAPGDALDGLGLDLEPNDPLPARLWDTILTLDEQRRLNKVGTGLGWLGTLIFSAKEAVYKCQYPLTGAMLAFWDVEIDLDQESGAFRCRSARSMPVVDRIEGRFAVVAGHVLATATVRKNEIGRSRHAGVSSRLAPQPSRTFI